MEYQILEENFYNGSKGNFRRRVPGMEGGKIKTPEDYQQRDTSRKPRKRRRTKY
ncbi:hypothetical protein CPC08DRAFT_715817 [Agrocybe pediades]|nr:hypothetical protein CPC08DRAFT_715817 [Agrocybe pediades]